MSDGPTNDATIAGGLLMVRAEAIQIFVFLENAKIRRRHWVIGRREIEYFFGSRGA